MLDKIQTKIDTLEQGKKLILGSGIGAEEMQEVIALCETLESSGLLRIVNISKVEGQKNASKQSIMIERQ